MKSSSLAFVILILAAAHGGAGAQTRSGVQAEQARDGEWCREDLAELEAELQENTRQGNTPQPERKYQHLRQAAQIFNDNGRTDACRMVIFEIRAMRQYDKVPMPGTNSP